MRSEKSTASDDEMDTIYEFPLPRKRRFIGGNLCEFGVPKENGLLWSILLSFLLNSDYENSDCENSDCKNSDSSSEETLAKHAVFNAKRFYSDYNIFGDPLQYFQQKQYLNILCTKIEKKKKSESLELAASNNLVLQAAADLLYSKITLIKDISESDVTTEVIIPGYSKDSRSYSDIYVFQKQGNSAESPCYSFGVKETLLFEMQRNAIVKILELPKDFDEKYRFEGFYIPDIVGIGINFAEKILKYEKQPTEVRFDFLVRLYTQPPYIFEKLSKTVVTTYPTELTFFYALHCVNFTPVLLLYDYSVNYPQWLLNSSREINDNVTENMVCMSKKLASVRSLAETFNSCESEYICTRFDSNKIYKKHIDELILIHEFRVALNNRALELSSQEVSGTNKETCITPNLCVKDSLFSVLKIYKDYFHLRKMIHFSKDFLYAEFSNYFDYVDIFASLKYFDYSFLLKRFYNVDERETEEFQSALFSLLFFKFHIEQDKTKYSNMQEVLVLKHVNRQNFLECLEKYINCFENNIGLVKKNINYPEDNDDLRSEPEIKDEFILSRLTQYLNTVANLDEEDETKNEDLYILTVQRCLQVVGEGVKYSAEYSPTVIKSMLASVFPHKISKCLGQLRNKLSHYYKELLQAKSKPLDINIFIGIKAELNNLRNKMKHIVTIQKLRTNRLIHKKVQNLVSILEQDKAVQFTNVADMEIKNITNKLYNHLQDFQLYFQNHSLNIKYSYKVEIKSCQNEQILETIKIQLNYYKILLRFWMSEFITASEYKGDNCEGLQIILLQIDKESFDGHPNTVGSIKKFSQEALEKLNKYQSKALHEMRMTKLSDIKASVDISNITNLLGIYKGKWRLTKTEKVTIQKDVPLDKCKEYDSAYELLTILRAKEKEKVDQKRIDDLFLNIADDDNNKNILRKKFESENVNKFENHLKNWKNPCSKLQIYFEKKSMSQKEYDEICTTCTFNQNTKGLLRNLVNSNDDNFCVDALKFLEKRIKQLKTLLLARVPHEARKDLVNEQNRVLQIVMRDDKLRAAIEMVVCDCTELLQWRKELKHMWIKQNRLFNGVDLRNVLCHGDTSIDAASLLLDNYDLPNEMVEKVLELVSDYDCIRNMLELYNTISPTGNLKYKNFIKFIESKNSDGHEMHKKIIV